MGQRRSLLRNFLFLLFFIQANAADHPPIKYLLVVRDPRDVAVSWTHFRSGIKENDTAAVNKVRREMVCLWDRHSVFVRVMFHTG